MTITAGNVRDCTRFEQVMDRGGHEEFRHRKQAREEAGGLGKVVLDTYEPEVERYGGPAAIGHAECLLHADSESVVALSATAPDRQACRAITPGHGRVAGHGPGRSPASTQRDRAYVPAYTTP
ncbi:lantibiotic dehydratase C-terminal domain-containing protein [Streptomyces sp. NPDC048483]|uniref:lantibiotic dehydratase C-terminal domain-containing protein n=1 Tax=Streptomyces sp. NPDC048483 TaxID=3154927 RepID=UPI003440B034